MVNVIDATYRADLRELNELNFARFDAKLEQRVAELETKLDRRMAELETKLERRMAELEAKLDRRTGELERAMEAGFECLRTELATQRAEMIKWSFLFWIGMVVTVFVSRVI
ncbi:MAG TPA: hypothetical protein VGA78_04325 [Gemmatimonadales bacterium]